MPANEINGSGHYHNNGTQTAYDTKIDMKEETYSSSQEDLRKALNDTILKRIPVGAQATTVLVSEKTQRTQRIFAEHFVIQNI